MIDIDADVDAVIGFNRVDTTQAKSSVNHVALLRFPGIWFIRECGQNFVRKQRGPFDEVVTKTILN